MWTGHSWFARNLVVLWVLVWSAAPAVAQGVEEGYFTGADNNCLFYRKLGSGSPVVVYLHGGPININNAGYDIDRLAKGRTLIMFDMRSGGRSQLLGDRALLGFERYVADVEALRQHFGLEKMILAGLSFGAMVGARYALDHPGVVTRLLLWSPGWPAWEFAGPRAKAEQAFIGPAASARSAEIARRMPSAPDSEVIPLCREDVRLTAVVYVTDPNSLSRTKGDWCSGTPASIRHQYLAQDVLYSPGGYLVTSWDVRPDLPRLQIPLLVLEGAETRIPLDATRTWARLAPNARMLLLAHSGHEIYLEGGEAFFEASDAFLSGRWPEGATVVSK
jgi:pimeloyl-ACP methyl ester carboxylesterase